MKKLFSIVSLTLFFFLALILAVYLTFPFDRVVKGLLCHAGVEASEVEFKRFPPTLIVKDAKVSALNTPVRLLKLSPSLGWADFEAHLCGGKVWGEFNFGLSRLTFHLKDLKLEECLKESSLPLGGRLSGSGELTFDGEDIIGGSGSFKVEDFSLVNLKLGLFEVKLLKFDKGADASYRVKDRNLIAINAKGEGDSASFELNGKVEYEPRNPEDSTIDGELKVSFEGTSFTFKLKGKLSTLKVW
jgi:hypothetical protein